MINYTRRNSSGKTTEVRTIDLQLSRVARPSVDLAYFFGSSLSPKTREESKEKLMRRYHDIFTEKLVGLGYAEDLYTLDDLKADYEECLPFQYTMSVMHETSPLIGIVSLVSSIGITGRNHRCRLSW